MIVVSINYLFLFSYRYTQTTWGLGVGGWFVCSSAGARIRPHSSGFAFRLHLVLQAQGLQGMLFFQRLLTILTWITLLGLHMQHRILGNLWTEIMTFKTLNLNIYFSKVSLLIIFYRRLWWYLLIYILIVL